MARPKRDPDKKPAFERIEDAFWDILSEKPFDKITISELSKRAGVNHNLLYYYFDGIEDMARQLFERNMSDGVPQRILGILLGNADIEAELLADDMILKRVMRTRLFMRRDSAFLNEIVRIRIQKEWLVAAGVIEKQLTQENKVDLDFIFSGVVAIVGSEQFEENQQAIASLNKRVLGKGIIDTLKNFSNN